MRTLVRQFHEAVNARDADAAGALVTSDVEIDGPPGRGTAPNCSGTGSSAPASTST
jgi:hypothetical protein